MDISAFQQQPICSLFDIVVLPKTTSAQVLVFLTAWYFNNANLLLTNKGEILNTCSNCVALQRSFWRVLKTEQTCEPFNIVLFQECEPFVEEQKQKFNYLYRLLFKLQKALELGSRSRTNLGHRLRMMDTTTMSHKALLWFPSDASDAINKVQNKLHNYFWNDGHFCSACARPMLVSVAFVESAKLSSVTNVTMVCHPVYTTPTWFENGTIDNLIGPRSIATSCWCIMAVSQKRESIIQMRNVLVIW